VSFAGVAIVTFVANRLIPVNTTTVGFAYLLLVLVIASAWGFLEAALASVLATLLFNFFFFPPVGKFTIADPQNWRWDASPGHPSKAKKNRKHQTL
jgi:two-component system, OmpR family, sensor histidine kinase KdpD